MHARGTASDLDVFWAVYKALLTLTVYLLLCYAGFAEEFLYESFIKSVS